MNRGEYKLYNSGGCLLTYHTTKTIFLCFVIVYPVLKSDDKEADEKDRKQNLSVVKGKCRSQRQRQWLWFI